MRIKPLAVRIETDEDLAATLRDVRLARNETQEDVEFKVGLTSGHLGKIEHGGKTWGKQLLRMTITLKWLFEYFGLTLMVVDKETAAMLTGPHIQERLRRHVRKATGEAYPNAQRLMVRLTRRPE